MNSKIVQALHSRTVWVVVIMALFNLIPQLSIDQSLKDLINGILVVVASYFHVNPNMIYTPSGITPPLPGQTVTLTQPV